MTDRSSPQKGSRERQQTAPSGPRPARHHQDTAKSARDGSAMRHHGSRTDIPSIQGGDESIDLELTRTTSPESIETSPPPTLKNPKSKPSALRLNTFNLLLPESSSKGPVSPSLQHWQQVRNHVLATPAEERAAQSHARTAGNDKKKLGLVSKAAGRFGIKQAADRVIRGDERRKSTMGMQREFGELSVEEREEIARERRRFARDVKGCLDDCAAEESRRRLARLGELDNRHKASKQANDSKAAAPLHAGPNHSQRPQYTNEFYAFAPLLTELHRHMPAARAKKAWSRTCPHHAAILAELRTAFLDDQVSTDGDRQQALEVFGTVVRSWSAENPEEELSRWLWLCHVLRWDDRHLRDRGLALLEPMLRLDETNAVSLNRPYSALSVQSLGVALIRLLRALETSRIVSPNHVDTVSEFLTRLGDGQIIDLDESTVGDLIGEYEFHGSQGGVCNELVWASAGVVAGCDIVAADWLLRDRAANLKRFCPPTILHGAPPSVMHLRTRAMICCLVSLTSLIPRLDSKQIANAWYVASELLEPARHDAQSGEGRLAKAWANFLLAIEASQHGHDTIDQEQEDPFKVTIKLISRAQAPTEVYRNAIARYMNKGDVWRDALIASSKRQGTSGALEQVTGLSESLLATRLLSPLGEVCVDAIWVRLVSAPTTVTPNPTVSRFLGRLQAQHPQTLYKTLFTCSAAATSITLSPPLRLTQTLSTTLGADQFWLNADPDMVAIVLMGSAGPKVYKGKGKEGQSDTSNVKLGRYAMMVELLKALKTAARPGQVPSRVRTFVERLESRVAIMLETEEKSSRLPDDYRALVCRLLFSLRKLNGSIKRPLWKQSILRWYFDSKKDVQAGPGAGSALSDSLDQLRGIYRSFEAQATVDSRKVQPSKRMTANFHPKRQATLAIGGDVREPLLFLDLSKEIPPLLVMIQATFSLDDWTGLFPRLWSGLTVAKAAISPSTFLVMKCCEKCPMVVRDVITRDLTNNSPEIRSAALRKLARLYGWRYQVLNQDTLTDRRGPIFHFAMQNLGYVSTEIGVPHWLQPQEVQDAALQKFGNTLPLELRQRLMELGWTEDDEMVGKRDWEHLPLTSLPPLQPQVEDDPGSKSPASTHLHRASSNGSAHSVRMKRRKPVFAQLLSSILVDQSNLLSGDSDSVVSTTCREVVNIFQRDDATHFFRTFGEGFRDDLPSSLVRLRSVARTTTPGFAFAAFNALVGHSRSLLRNDPGFPHYIDILTTIAIIMPGLSGVSLRDIRKNRSEHVLLPASIHEDEGGYKLHAPWREGNIEAQTAQLLVLIIILRNNPRDVYLAKKMVSNLQVQGSIQSVAFSRAWLLLIIQLFSTVNRNYNDRAELRHFLSNVSLILEQHHHDLLVVSHAMRVYMLCSARFRRVYASVGFNTTTPAIYLAYASGNEAIQDSIEYAMRSFYRIHSDSFVHHACISISEIDVDPKVVYKLLASLADRNSPKSGVASGVRGLNQKEEIDALVQMISGPELAFSEIGTAAAERRASKIASIDFEETVFPLPHIVKLFITVIAANPASKRGIQFLYLLAGMVPHIEDSASQILLRDSVEALGRIVVKGRSGDDVALRALVSSDDGTKKDWIAARVSYLAFVDTYARSGGQLSATVVKRVLHLIPELLDKSPKTAGATASEIIGTLADTHLGTARPVTFLRDIASLFSYYIAMIDFSGLLDSISDLIVRSSFDLDTETTAIIIDKYLHPAVRWLGSASGERMAFVMPLRSSTVTLLAAAVYLPSDAWSTIEKVAPTASLLASVIFPFTLLLEPPKNVDRNVAYSNLWIRILNFVLSRHGRHDAQSRQLGKVGVAREVLVFQIIKIVIVRAPESISSVPGLWNHLADQISKILQHADERVCNINSRSSPRLVNWMMWSLYELLCLHQSPLMVSFRDRIQLALSRSEETPSRPSSPGARSRAGSRSPSLFSDDKPRAPSLAPSSIWHERVPSFQHESNVRARGMSVSTTKSRPSLSPNPDRHPASSDRTPSHNLRSSTRLGYGAPPSHADQDQARRPSFVDRSARRPSKPVFDLFQGGVGMNFRFPSSSSIRQLPAEKGGGAIVHLLGAPSQVSSAITGGVGLASPIGRGRGRGRSKKTTEDQETSVAEVLMTDQTLIKGMRRSLKTCQIVFGYDVEWPEDEDPVRTWTVQDALDAIAKQTRLIVENEFGDLFNPPRHETSETEGGHDLSLNEDSLKTMKRRDGNDDDDGDDNDNEHLRAPILNR